jgi:hypothetical protein
MRVCSAIAILIFWCHAVLAVEPASSRTSHPKRVVIDVQDPNAVRMLRTEITPSSARSAEVPPPNKDRGIQIPWESSAVLHSQTGPDSFRVSSSRSGCPGTVIRPSVSVAFATTRGWSDPPIRFGPLASKTICSLGKGVELEVRAPGGAAPYVKLVERNVVLSKR